MIFEQKTYNDLNNSMLVAGLINEKDRSKIPCDCPMPKGYITDNLGMISALYIYTGVPPYGYGTQGPKVFETVKRAYSYNKKKENKTLKIWEYDIEFMQWEKGEFPHEEVHGNYSLDDAINMSKIFLIKHTAYIDEISDKVINNFMERNSDILTKGRQTFCPFSNQSTTAAVAYKRMYEFFKLNTGKKTYNCLEWIKTYFTLLEKNHIKARIVTERWVRRRRYNRVTRQTFLGNQKLIEWKASHYYDEEAKKFVMNLSRSFASYLKHKERGKKDRRAIASANMILRMFLTIIEEFHLTLGKMLPGSTISIGGEEKKAKILTALQQPILPSYDSTVKAQGTEDATKWNECISPEIFNVMHKCFFSDNIRKKEGLPKISENSRIFKRICTVAHFLMSIKRVITGPGPIGISEGIYNRVEWKHLHRLNGNTRNNIAPIYDKLEGDFIFSSPGMLMGMLNAASTTVGLLAQGYALNPNQEVITLRSSDDSTTVYAGDSPQTLENCIEKTRRSLSLLGINMSKEKTFFFTEGYSEYTSWYQDKKFLSQYGVETSTLRPQGKNPYDDAYNIAKGTATALQTLSINHLGAMIKLLIGIDNVRRLWRVEMDNLKRGMGPKIQLIADGGINIWDTTNCHLEEISFRRTFAQNDTERNYFYVLCDPKNPFSSHPEEDVTFSRELSRVVVSEIDTIRNIFTYVKRTNRTAKNSMKKSMFNQERICGEAISIVKATIPITMLQYPTESSSIANNLIAALTLQSVDLDLDQCEKAELNRCINILNNGKDEESDGDDFDDFINLDARDD
uniref:RNA-directed RNA polymerase catalytic subunit n=2 Tax=Hubei earwig virus 1 TaxID=1922890 RepID=A0A1L3KKE0_9VIRU|nr:polymerase PB1 [Hubei earwig virus 1]